jgi:hypothetical protein
MDKRILAWEPWFFMAFGLFHLHILWGLIDRSAYTGFWIGVLENRGLFYFVLMGTLAALCILGILTFIKNLRNNYWWRWIYLFGGIYVLFDLFAVAAELEFWNKLLLWMFDVKSGYWDILWLSFILLGGFVSVLGIKLLLQRKRICEREKEVRQWQN